MGAGRVWALPLPVRPMAIQQPSSRIKPQPTRSHIAPAGQRLTAPGPALQHGRFSRPSPSP